MADSPNKTTHAQRRRMESHKAARARLQAGQFVRRLKEIAEKAESVDAAAIPALRLKADIYSRLLAKCLPDLKAVEHSGEIGHREITQYTEAELAAELARVRAAIDGAAEPSQGPQSPAGVH